MRDMGRWYGLTPSYDALIFLDTHHVRRLDSVCYEGWKNEEIVVSNSFPSVLYSVSTKARILCNIYILNPMWDLSAKTYFANTYYHSNQLDYCSYECFKKFQLWILFTDLRIYSFSWALLFIQWLGFWISWGLLIIMKQVAESSA